VCSALLQFGWGENVLVCDIKEIQRGRDDRGGCGGTPLSLACSFLPAKVLECRFEKAEGGGEKVILTFSPPPPSPIVEPPSSFLTLLSNLSVIQEMPRSIIT